jgi:HK97 gp10 family phage protein
MRFTIDRDGLAEAHRLVERARDRVVDEIAADARRRAPVDTGALLVSIDAGPGRVTAGTDHWLYVEYGTRYQRAQSFMRPALYTKRRLR